MKYPLQCFWRLTILLLLVALSNAVAAQEDLRGFIPSRSKSERVLEKTFMAVPNSRSAENNHRALTAEPHMAGSVADRRVSEYVLAEFRKAGLDSSIEEFEVLLSEPREVKLDLVSPVKFSGPTREFVDVDPASKDPRNTIGFNAYSASGDVTADVIYANYGLLADYQYLREMGISAEGKIVIVRRGEDVVFRGVKAKIAEENKARGLIIYSDPEDDGYHAGDPYPKGRWRPPTGVERGTLLYEFISPRDPTAPDVPGAPRVDIRHAITLPHILALPLSYSDATPILENLAGPSAPRAWQGGLPFTYHIGPGLSKVRLRIQMENVVKPIWIVVAKIPGAEYPDELVVLGNHHDAWTYGGADPGSGTAAMLETARGLGELLHTGWRPRRSIWLCSWDAEEQGMIGSTEWAEKHADELQRHALAYLNLDVAAAGDDFEASAVPSLKQFMREVAADVPDPNGSSVLDRANRQLRENLRRSLFLEAGTEGKPENPPIADRQIEIEDLGGGTDFVPFLYHLGIASTDFSFGSDVGVYHSVFDNHRWMEKFGDPGFRYHVAAARYYGLQALRLAEADLLPFDYAAYGQEIQNYLNGIPKNLVLLHQADHLDLSSAQNAARQLADAGRDLRVKYEEAVSRGEVPPDLEPINLALAKAERAFLLPDGLPGRPWYKHAIVAPGFYTADASLFLPGVQGDLERVNFEDVRRQLDAVTAAINTATKLLKSAQQTW